MRELTNFAESLGWKFKNQTHDENGSFITFMKDPDAWREVNPKRQVAGGEDGNFNIIGNIEEREVEV